MAISAIVNLPIEWLQVKNVSHPFILPELSAITVLYLLARQIAKRLRQYIEKTIKEAKHPGEFKLSPEHFPVIIKYVLYLQLLWLCYNLFKSSGIPAEIFRLAHNVTLALLVYRFASWYIKSTFWSRVVFIACLLVIALRATDSWTQMLHLLDSRSITLGNVKLSLLGAAEMTFTFFILWSTSVMLYHFFSLLLATSVHLSYSDRRLLQGVIEFAVGVDERG